LVSRQQLHDAAHRTGAVKIPRGAAHDFHAIDGRERNAVPVDPTAERIIQRHAIGEHERAARARTGHAAQRHALRRGIGDARRRAAEQRKTRSGSQRVIECAGRHVAQLGRGQHRGTGRGWQTLGAARGRDHDRIGKIHRSQDDLHGTGARHWHIGRLEPFRADTNARGNHAGIEVTVRIAADGGGPAVG
jgi:hypothetical protein